MRRPPKIISPLRRTLRILTWTTLFTVLGVRLVFHWLDINPFQLQPAPWMGGGGPGGPGGPWGRRPPVRLYTPSKPIPTDLYRLEIEIAEADENKLRGHFWNGWNGGRGGQDDRPEVRVTVREGGVTYTNVSLHLKGAAGSFRPFDDKPALTLNFSKGDTDQDFHGFNKISLNNSVQDPSFISEQLCRELFLAAGVPTPRSDHATVVINGRDLGLYVLVEGWGKRFLKRHFKDVRGNLYDSGFVQDVDGNMSVNSGEKPDDRSDLERLSEAAHETNSRVRWEKLSRVLDVDRFISMLALEIMTCHWDGYSRNRNNFRVFHDLTADRMVFMPHGMDQMFGWGQSQPTDSLRPSMQGLVARAVATTPEGRKLLDERIRRFQQELFLEDKLTQRVDEIAARLRPTLTAYSEGLARDHDQAVAHLKRRITERVASIADQLSAPQSTLAFNPDGLARPTGWKSRIVNQNGQGISFEQRELEGRRVLGIRSRGGGNGSWRTRVQLEGGRYRFVAKARLENVGNSGGVGLRVSGVRSPVQRFPDGEWVDLSYDLELGDVGGEVELICEFSGSTGQAWFDEASLQLLRQ